MFLLLELGYLLAQKLYALVIRDPRGDIERVSADWTSGRFFGATLGRRLGRSPLTPFLQEVNGPIADHGLEKGDELRDRPAAELNEAASIKGGERVREDIVRIRLWEPEGTKGPAADFLEWAQERFPGIWVPAPTAVDQVEEIRADRALRYRLSEMAETSRRSLAFGPSSSQKRRERQEGCSNQVSTKQRHVDDEPAWPDCLGAQRSHRRHPAAACPRRQCLSPGREAQ